MQGLWRFHGCENRLTQGQAMHIACSISYIAYICSLHVLWYHQTPGQVAAYVCYGCIVQLSIDTLYAGVVTCSIFTLFKLGATIKLALPNRA
jgi:hypothetical protein